MSCEFCALWDWRNAAGRPKDMAARTLLLKLERAGCIALPARRGPSPNARRNLHIAPVAAPEEPINCALRELQPLGVTIAKPGTPDARLVQGMLAHEHYLGARNSVGENIRYLVRDRFGRPTKLWQQRSRQIRNRRAGCGKSASPVRRGERDKPMSRSYLYPRPCAHQLKQSERESKTHELWVCF